MNSPVVHFLILFASLISYACATTTCKRKHSSSGFCINFNIFSSVRMCVPHHIIDACKEVASKSNRDVRFECIAGRDRFVFSKLIFSRLTTIVTTTSEWNVWKRYRIDRPTFWLLIRKTCTLLSTLKTRISPYSLNYERLVKIITK